MSEPREVAPSTSRPGDSLDESATVEHEHDWDEQLQQGTAARAWVCATCGAVLTGEPSEGDSGSQDKALIEQARNAADLHAPKSPHTSRLLDRLADALERRDV